MNAILSCCFSSMKNPSRDRVHFVEISPSMIKDRIQAPTQGSGVELGGRCTTLGGVNSQEAFEAAKKSAAQDGREISLNIQNRNFTEAQRFEIAKIAAAQNGMSVSIFIQNYKLTQQQYFEIAQIAVTQNPIVFYTEIESYQLRDADLLITIKSFAHAAEERLGIKEIVQGIESLDNQSRKRMDFRWLSDVIGAKLDKDDALLLISIWQINNSKFRQKATDALLAIRNDPEKKAMWKNLMIGTKCHLQLPLLFAVHAGIEKETIEKLIEELKPGKYKGTRRMMPIIEILSALSKSTVLSPMDRQGLVELVFHVPKKESGEPQPHYKRRLEEYRKNQFDQITALHTLLLFSQDQLLKNRDKPLVELVQQFLSDTFDISAEKLPNFVETFCQSKRYPNGLSTYAACLMTLPENESRLFFSLLKQFARDVLDGTFSEKRYCLKENKHLQTIAADYPNLFATWKKALPIKIKRADLPDTPQQQMKPSWTIEDTDAWEDLLLTGTEVDGSCLHIQNDPVKSQYLFSYILDGKMRLMIARESSGKVIGRAILRILWDEYQQQPVLFVEKVYAAKNANVQQLQQEIFEGCRQKAKSMKISLVTSPDSSTLESLQKRPLRSLGGPAPYEYVDDLRSVCRNGVYCIPFHSLL